ncbi:MAG: amidophosphoribosyltransferase [Phycisphaera sp.]|nr:amidophosphoribosyltransferase [Phycisphaera sp.]
MPTDKPVILTCSCKTGGAESVHTFEEPTSAPPTEYEKKEKCGVFGVWGAPDAAQLIYTAMYAQQHRGQESAGIAVTDGQTLQNYVGMGLVPEVFDEHTLKNLQGSAGIGHNRYSTTGSSHAGNAQPLLKQYIGGQVAVAHNGNLINAELLRDTYERRGHIFTTTTDTEVIIHILACHHLTKHDPLVECLEHLQGAYSLLFLFKDRIEAVRDPWGWRPLVIGRTQDGHACVASETVAFDAIGATFVEEVQPGEIVTLSDAGITKRRYAEAQKAAHCIFEHIYFANPSSMVFGDRVQLVRERLGERLAQESPVDADCVIPMPDSGRSAALGFARRSGIAFREGIVPNRYVGRTFIQPSQSQRDNAVQLKLNVIREVVEDKRIVVVDDSIVRGTTTRGKMNQLRRAGAKEIHLRISCPPIRHACYFGIDFPDPSKLIASNRTVEQIREFLGVDSLHFLSHDGMLGCVNRPREHYCTACFSGEYRLNAEKPVNKLGLERYQLKMFS